METRIKTGGRKAGTPNKITKDLREKFKLLIEDNVDKLQNDIEQLEPKDRIKVIIDLSKFVLPTLRATDLKTNTDYFTPTIINLGNGIQDK
tara:strand:+ start:22 stop:294 length:273 start_codon:yes stop_codon:yes gene_type:complete